MQNWINATLLGLSLVLMSWGQGFAQEAAVTVTAEGGFSGEAFTVGWEFEVDSPVSVSAFGRVLAGTPSADSEVRLYRLDTGASMGAATILQSATGESAGAIYQSYFAELPAPLLLDPGVRYLIAVEALNGDGFLEDTPVTVSSPIRYIQGRGAGSGLSLPTTADATTFPITRNVSGVSYLGPTFRFSYDGTGIDPLTISSLDARSVFQRDLLSGSASLPVSGVFGSAPVTRVEARAVPTEGGVAVDWTTIDASPSAGAFSGSLTVSGGRYRIEARAFDANGIRYAGSVSLVGVGDVYVVAGQSNAGNYGETLQSASDDRVSTVDLDSNLWLKASDPMPNADGSGGSAWSDLGDLLVAQENVPVAIITVAHGGTRVDHWLPGEDLYTEQLMRALNFTRNHSGLRAVLWHQGETDAAAGTSTALYAQRLQSIIAESRLDAGFEVPWGVALASADPLGSVDSEAAVVAGQQAVIDADPLVFQGASTNDFGGLGFLYDGVHFAEAGLREHAERWVEPITTFFDGNGSGPSSALDLTGEGTFSSDGFTVGWEFNVTSEMTVTRLGRVLPLGSALGADSPAAIYNLSTGAQVASAIIKQEAIGEPLSAYQQSHYAVLAAPVTLTAGATYVVLVEALDGAGFLQDVPGTTVAGVNYLQGRATDPNESLPASATTASLPLIRNGSGLSYLGATFDVVGGNTPTNAGGAALVATGEGIYSNDTFTVGWQFRVSEATEVTRLGRVTTSGDVLASDSPTAIYRLDTGGQVASVTIPAASAGESIGSVYQAHYASLSTPVTLQAGRDYVILTEALDGVGFYQDVPSTMATEITYVAGRATASGAPLPALANDSTLPVTRDDAGVSYLGAIFEVGGDTAPPVPGTTDALGAIAFPTTVESPSTVTIEIPYETTQRRALQIRLHDLENGYETVGQADTTVEAGSGTLSISVPVLTGARVGSDYLWALRLLPVDWTSIDQSLAEAYGDAVVEINNGGGATNDLLLSVDVPSSVESVQTVPVTVNYEATERRTLAVWLHDLNDNFSTIGFAQATVDPGFGTQTFDIGIVGGARIGSGHLWAVRLLPEGETDDGEALDGYFQAATLTERATNLVNYAVLPEAVTTQSSIFGGFLESRLAADGNTDGDWRNGSVTHTELETNAWWEVDLGSVKAIDNILVWNRTDCCAERLSPFYVMVSDTPFTSQDLDATVDQAGVSSYQVTETPVPTRQVNVNRSGRYVRVQLAGANYLSLAEVEVYGVNEGLVNGLAYEYYEGVWNELPDFDELSPIETGTTTNFDISDANQNNFFAMRFRGCLNVPADGNYTFYTASDAGSSLSIDGNVVVNNDGLHSLREVSGSVTLTAGMHPVEVQFFERTGAATLAVSWAGDGISKQPISDAFLFVNETGISPAFHHVGRQVAADDNADGDLLDVTGEYALGRDPSIASMSDLGLHVESTADQLNVWYDRPARLEEIAYTLEYSDDLATWTEILSPTVTSEVYGTERVRYTDLGQLSIVNRDRGFVRLRIRHHAWNHESTSPTSGWYSTKLHDGYQTHGISLNRGPVFGSTVADFEDQLFVSTSAGLSASIVPGRAYYLEMTSGALEGHRLELDEAGSEDQRLAIEWTSPLNTLAETFPQTDALEASFVVREHWTLEDAYPSAPLQASTDPVLADQIQFFDGQSQSFESLFVLGDGSERFWVANDDATLASQAGRILPPGVGYFIKRPEESPTHTIRLTGHVREGAFIQPLAVGHNLVALARPLTSNTQERGLTLENGFLGSRDPDAADQIQIWKGNAAPGEQSYESYFLLDAGEGAARYWTRLGDAALENAEALQVFTPDRAVFIQLVDEAYPSYRVPAMAQ